MDFIDFEAIVASDNEVSSEDEVSDVDSLNLLLMIKPRLRKTEHITISLKMLPSLLMKL